jgi:hypothetical protein
VGHHPPTPQPAISLFCGEARHERRRRIKSFRPRPVSYSRPQLRQPLTIPSPCITSGRSLTRSFQDGAPAGRSGKGLMWGPFAGTRAAKARRVDFALLLFGVGSGWSLAVGMCQLSPRRMRSWLSLGSLQRRSAVFWVSIFSLRSMGKILRSWCRGSRGAVRNAPDITRTASFWTN